MTEIRIITSVEIHKRLQVEAVVQSCWVLLDAWIEDVESLVLVQVFSVEFQAYSSQQTDLALL